MRRVKLLALSLLSTGTLGLGGGCLPDNFWSDKAGEIVNGIIIGVVDLALTPTGIDLA